MKIRQPNDASAGTRSAPSTTPSRPAVQAEKPPQTAAPKADPKAARTLTAPPPTSHDGFAPSGRRQDPSADRTALTGQTRPPAPGFGGPDRTHSRPGSEQRYHPYSRPDANASRPPPQAASPQNRPSSPTAMDWEPTAPTPSSAAPQRPKPTQAQLGTTLTQQLTNQSQPVNPHGLDQNCYYCTAAVLSGQTTGQTVKWTQTMQQNTENLGGISQLMHASGASNGKYLGPFNNLNEAMKQHGSQLDGRMFGVAYTYGNAQGPSAGHMVVGMGGKNGVELLDFQQNPPTRHNQLPGNTQQVYIFPTQNLARYDVQQTVSQMDIQRPPLASP